MSNDLFLKMKTYEKEMLPGIIKTHFSNNMKKIQEALGVTGSSTEERTIKENKIIMDSIDYYYKNIYPKLVELNVSEEISRGYIYFLLGRLLKESIYDDGIFPGVDISPFNSYSLYSFENVLRENVILLDFVLSK